MRPEYLECGNKAPKAKLKTDKHNGPLTASESTVMTPKTGESRQKPNKLSSEKKPIIVSRNNDFNAGK